jgi:hypothetical protein
MRRIITLRLIAPSLVVAAFTACDVVSASRQPREADEVTTLGPEDSIGALTRLIQRRTRTEDRLAEEKDTLLHTLQTAMLLFNELADVEREIVSEEMHPAEGALQPWDDRVRSQLQRLRGRYADLAQALTRAEQRLQDLQGQDRRARAALAEALRTAATLREDNEKKQALIENLSSRVASLTQEKDAAVALSEARADTIRSMADETNTVFWVAGSEDELKRLGLIETVGGRRLLFTRVGERLNPSRSIDPNLFRSIDRRRSHVIHLPDGAEYEILTPQDPALADAATLRTDGERWFVRDELRITDARFWEPNTYLILVRR